ncbi:MAG: hypothetical protein BZY79_03945 [SAR202 cluster bacterium Casp-Chloro-G4]|nr:DUF488 domain-containing protein [Chloroflexota bacterium]PKB61351.1 MAG: hypothetical protein BZY79_03945 [SAR202 cluster bacterium Casp-Chloro-G4]
MTTIYTIGHSNHKWETFLPLLKLHGIKLLADVRSRPVSRFASFTNKGRFSGLLAQESIEYLFMGESLGGKPEDPSLYDDDGKPDYGKMARHIDFLAGIVDLVALAEKSAIAIMCSEGDPAQCHRSLLMTPAIEAQGAEVLHIRRTGEVTNQLPMNV